ncbi:MAG: arginine--tRNA ligase [Syntrophobacteraceae bacterium]
MKLVRDTIIDMLVAAVSPLLEREGLPALPPSSVELVIPKSPEHGDYATNVAMSLTRQLRRKPRDIATEVVERLPVAGSILSRVEIAGPGFLNFFIRPDAWHAILKEINVHPDVYGRGSIGNGKRVQVEFVSANPTGPLHIGHGRGAATGDVMANILEACGFDVQREYYINDAGNQMDTLGASLYHRYQEILGENVDFPDNHYRGDYMKELATAFRQKAGDQYLRTPLPEVLPVFTRFAADSILDGIREDLDIFGVSFDEWFSERALHEQDAVSSTIAALRAAGHIYDSEGATWFRSTSFGDEKDRVVIRANGVSTYFAADLAYHKNKYDRGFDTVIDIWGADHHGYVPRMMAGVEAMGRERSDLHVILIQLVNLLRGGTPVAMSTRAGEFVTLREVIDEVGKDAARYIFLTRRSDSPLDFDLDVAKMQSNENPVYYVQYAHARLSSVFEVARDRGIACGWLQGGDPPDLSSLQSTQEIALMRLLGEYPQLLVNCARSYEPHLIAYFLHELVSTFHSYYNQNRILGEDMEISRARLYLAAAVRNVIGNALAILGVHAPDKM